MPNHINFHFQNMQTRNRKIMRGDNDADAIIRQLDNDFEVFEYLKENKLETTNIEEYAKLFNSLIVEGQDRRTAYSRVRAEFRQMREKEGECDEQLLQGRKQMLEMIQEQTCKEMEVSRDLEKEIIETKKSLNLLKGDIGHLVSRNESAKLLGSKITKVKIVADDQLKRVTLAYIKDKEEIKLRNEMQKKFSKKLKNVSSYESSSLGRLKKNYAESVMKKQDIFEKLVNSQKISQNVEEAEMLKQLKAEKDTQNQQEMEVLVHLKSVVEEFNLARLASLISDPSQLAQQITEFYHKLPSVSLEDHEDMGETITKAATQILTEYHKIEESIKNLSQFYQDLLIIRKENQEKLAEYQKEEGELLKKFSIELEEGFKIDQESMRAYQSKLKLFASVLSTLFVILSYLQKNAVFQTSYPMQYKLFAFEKEKERQSRMDRKSIVDEKQPTRYNFISCLKRVYQLLSSSISSHSQLSFCPEKHKCEMNEFYGSLLQNARVWLEDIKKRFSADYFNHILDLKKTRSPATRYSVIGNSRRTTHFKKESSSVHQDDEDIHNDEREELNYVTQGSAQNHQYAKSPSVSSLPQSPSESAKARRIKLLEGIDSDYYKMIKSTIKMEKENTRKNYQFLRTFKRAKYASRDNILQQKRFQSSFSVLFTKQSVSNLSKTSKFDASATFNGRSLNQSFNTRSFFKKSTNKFNHSGASTPTCDGKNFYNKSQLDAALRKSRMAQKLKQAMEFI